MDRPRPDDGVDGRPAAAGSLMVKAGDRVYETIKGEIYLSLRPGDRLTEQSVSERFGVSRIPVREALQRLVQEGYLQAHLRNGYTVKEISSRTYTELMELRVVLECQALRMISPDGAQRTRNMLTHLASVWETPEPSLSSHDVSALNRRFHQTLVDLTGNRELARVEQQTLERIEVAQRLDFTRPQRVEDTYREHGAILQALLNGDAERARRTLEAHIRNSARVVTAIMDPLGRTD